MTSLALAIIALLASGYAAGRFLRLHPLLIGLVIGGTLVIPSALVAFDFGSTAAWAMGGAAFVLGGGIGALGAFIGWLRRMNPEK